MDERQASGFPAWGQPFLDALRGGKSIAAAARAAGVGGTIPYGLRDRHAGFREAWEAIDVVDGRFRREGAIPTSRSTPKLDRFLAELAETSNVTAAAGTAGLAVGMIYKLRRSDPEFARRWYAALAEGYDNLEMELLGHLRAGGEAGAAGGRAPKFDTAAALRCLAAHRESVAREKGRRTLAEEVTTIAAINDKIDRQRLAEAQGHKAITQARREKARAALPKPTGDDGHAG